MWPRTGRNCVVSIYIYDIFQIPLIPVFFRPFIQPAWLENNSERGKMSILFNIHILSNEFTVFFPYNIYIHRSNLANLQFGTPPGNGHKCPPKHLRRSPLTFFLGHLIFFFFIWARQPTQDPLFPIYKKKGPQF